MLRPDPAVRQRLLAAISSRLLPLLLQNLNIAAMARIYQPTSAFAKGCHG
jgi:hypothetical protein